LNLKDFDEMADHLAKNLKTDKDVSAMMRMLAKVAMERAKEIEMEEHLGENKEGRRPSDNSRNGYTQKILKTDTGEIPLEIPRIEIPALNHNWSKRNKEEALI